MYSVDVVVKDRCVAHCTSWGSLQAVCLLMNLDEIKLITRVGSKLDVTWIKAKYILSQPEILYLTT